MKKNKTNHNDGVDETNVCWRRRGSWSIACYLIVDYWWVWVSGVGCNWLVGWVRSIEGTISVCTKQIYSSEESPELELHFWRSYSKLVSQNY